MFEDYLFAPVFRFMYLIISFTLLISLVTWVPTYFEYSSSETHYVQSVVLDDSLSGSFVMGTGVLNGDTYFIVYELQEDGGKVLKKYCASNVVVYDDLNHDDSAYLNKTMSGFLGLNFKVVFHVPKDTINKNLDINLSSLK